jgi:hypothetical protein
LVIGILIPKPRSIAVEEMQRTSIYFLPCLKKSAELASTYYLLGGQDLLNQ